MKKYITGIAIVISSCIFTGCGAQSPVADGNEENMTQVSESDMTADEENMTQMSETEMETKIETEIETGTGIESQEELLTDSVDQSRIDEVGTLANEHHEIYGETNPDTLLGEANFNWLVVDDSFAGAETINTYLYEAEVASAWSVFEDDVRADEEAISEFDMSYSYDSDVSYIRYFDGTYMSFVQENYEYFGGAHGMPFWNGYTFNLETGERLLLMDILSDTEDELKDIVTNYFGEMIDESPEDYWADAKETVHDTVSLETTDFVLTDEGICFYMYPYSIAAYVMGFPDVTIPYSEFNMKILN